MKFKVTKASDWCFEDSVEISTLEELLQFVENKYKEHENEKYELGLFNNFERETDNANLSIMTIGATGCLI